MTDRHKGYVVALDHDIREDDAQPIIDAIRMIKGVGSVEPILADGFKDGIIVDRVVSEMRTRLLQALRDVRDG